jgi:hypothetical protein
MANSVFTTEMQRHGENTGSEVENAVGSGTRNQKLETRNRF